MDTVMGAGKQNLNRHVQPAVRKDAWNKLRYF